MVTTYPPLYSLSVADLMSSDVVVIPREMSLRGAARLLSRAAISGAPVVDADGRCVGVLSSTDFMHVLDGGPRSARVPSPCFCSEWQSVNVEALPTENVATYMTPDPVTVTPAVLVRDLARALRDAHVHRAIVVDERGRPIGVVTSTDVLAAVARSPDE